MPDVRTGSASSRMPVSQTISQRTSYPYLALSSVSTVDSVPSAVRSRMQLRILEAIGDAGRATGLPARFDHR